ncbi:MAG: hypothetical protein IKQ53_01035 [Bacteroidales bacterium]|nr:hypothetical protein [Bacteroidales bacterium]
MNDKERDRSGDGAGPVANKVGKYKTTCLHSILAVLMFSFFASFQSANAAVVKPASLRGLSLTVDFGVMRPGNFHANFYNGNPRNVNTLQRILYSETYGNSIWNNLTTQNLLAARWRTTTR